uniref:Forkhead box R1 n=1 Tax=Nannospalax galili TaxID=1026970 RepID=A0A8C6S3R6_NANGA
MGNECFLAFTTDHLLPPEQNLAKYRLQIIDPPNLPLEKNLSTDKDGPDVEPNLWMWVNPNIVYPPGKLEVSGPKKEEDLPSMPPSCQLPLKEEARCSEALDMQFEELLPQKQKWKQQDDNSSVALPSPPTRAPLQSRRLQQTISLEGRLWSRPPLNYFHLIALALRNSPPCGLNVQQIYSFTRYVPRGPSLPQTPIHLGQVAVSPTLPLK